MGLLALLSVAALANEVSDFRNQAEQMRRDGLDGRANMTGMHPPKKDTAA